MIEDFSSLTLPCGFILFTYKYHDNKRKLFAAGVVILTLLWSIYKGRRGLSSIFLMTLIIAYFLYLIHTKKKVIIIYLSILFFTIGLFYASHLYHINQNELFGFIVQRGDEDTRTGVELLFYDDMKTKDWIIGRGINGEYFCPDIEENQLTNYRSYIETGYLQTILKGGLISLGLYLLIAVPAFILGIFYSRNLLAKAAGLWIFIGILSSYPTSVESFNLQFLLIWISIGICYSKEIRKLSDNTIKAYLRNT
jgi:hypothetical protein